MGGILITGGAGYIGSCFAWACRDAGVPFVVLDDLSTGDRGALPPGTPFVRAKVSDSEAVAQAVRVHGLDAIAHFAGSISVEESVRDPQKYWRNNHDESRALLATARDLGIGKLIFSSTAAIYGDAGGDPIPESRTPAPSTPYGETKAAVEAMLADDAGPLRFVVLRYFNVAGADPKLRAGMRAQGAGNLIKVCCEAALGERPQVVIHGTDYATPDGTCIRDFIHVADLVDAHLKALEHLTRGGPSLTLNCGYGQGYSVREVVEAFGEVTGRPLPAVTGPRRAGDIGKVISDAGRIRAELGWTPRHDDLRQIVTSALDWERSLQPVGAAAGTAR